MWFTPLYLQLVDCQLVKATSKMQASTTTRAKKAPDTSIILFCSI